MCHERDELQAGGMQMVGRSRCGVFILLVVKTVGMRDMTACHWPQMS